MDYRKVEIKNRLTGKTQLVVEMEGDVFPDLRDADLTAANLKDAHLLCANLCRAELCDADLRGADLRGAKLRYANLRGADLRGANLHHADLRGANLLRVDFQHANLRDTNFTKANLLDANLTGADVRGAFLLDAYFVNKRIGETNLKGEGRAITEQEEKIKETAKTTENYENTLQACGHTIAYWWDIPANRMSDEVRERLDAEAENRSRAMIVEDYSSGELNSLFPQDDGGEDEFSGWWSVQ